MRVVDELDYEESHHHGLTVRVTDLYSGATADTAVQIKVVDVNDCYPGFPVNVYHASVTEAASPGAFVVQVSASDKDTGVSSQHICNRYMYFCLSIIM